MAENVVAVVSVAAVSADATKAEKTAVSDVEDSENDVAVVLVEVAAAVLEAATAVTARESHSATVKAVVSVAIEQQELTASVGRFTCPNMTTRTKRHSSSTSP